MSYTATIEAAYTPIDLSADQMEHAGWNRATPIELTRYWSGLEAPSGRQAEARILWSEEALCVRFVCAQHEPLIVPADPQTHKKTLALWERDVCEIFIAPNPDEPNRYFEFEVAPTGEWIDLAVVVKAEEREIDWDFHSGMTAASHITGNQVIVVMRIPWDSWISKPKQGERWRVNLFRCVGSGADRGYLAWQPTHSDKPNFHVPGAFGWLVFTE